jgi:hypothetical protein
VNYHNSYNRNTNVNININNNYNNRFEGNANMKGGGTRSPIAGNTKAANRAAPKAGTSDWKGKSSYAGARPANSSKAATKGGGTKAARPANVDRGYGGGSATRATREHAPGDEPGHACERGRGHAAGRATRPPAARANDISGSGGYKHTVDANTGANVVSSTRDRPGGSSVDPLRPRAAAATRSPHGGSGSFDRAASARGQASTRARTHGAAAAAAAAEAADETRLPARATRARGLRERRPRPPPQRGFDSPESAVTALVTALEQRDRATLVAMLGPTPTRSCRRATRSPTAPRAPTSSRATRRSTSWSRAARTTSSSRSAPTTGRSRSRSSAAAASGSSTPPRARTRSCARRIGGNELQTIEVMHGYVAAQDDYASAAHDGVPAGTYATRDPQ